MCPQILALLEEDENCQQVVESLMRSGHTIVRAPNFTNAMAILQNEQFELIISDVHLENGGNVFDFLKWVKKNPATHDTPFVLFSSRPSPLAKYIEDGVRTTARILGASLYITMEIFDSNEFRRQIDFLLPDQVIELSPKGKQ